MTAPYPDVALNRGIQLRRIHFAPAGQLHDAPAYSGAAPPVVVRSRHYSEVKRVGEGDDARARSLNHADPLRCAVAELNSVHASETVQLVVWQLGDVSRNRENQHRDSTGYGYSGVARRVVPVSLRIERECRVDANCNDVFVLIACLERRQQDGCISRTCRIPGDSRLRSDEALVITDVRNIESCRVVPGTVAFWSEPVRAIP